MKYEKGKIYKLVDNTNKNIYIGSTIQSLSKRKAQHKEIKNKCKSKLIINNGDYDIILIENYPCSSKEELLARERYFIENIECINKIIPIITKKERKEYEIKYANENKDLIKIKSKEWYKNNKDKKKEYEIKYSNENKDLIKIKSKEWYINNKDKKKEYDKKYRDEKKEHYKKYFKEHSIYLKSWGGDKRTENNLLKISMDIFE